jgi:hypothetical protein
VLDDLVCRVGCTDGLVSHGKNKRISLFTSPLPIVSTSEGNEVSSAMRHACAAPGAGVAESPVKMEEADEPANGRARRAVAKAAAYAEVDSDQDVGTDSDSAFEISARPAPGKRAKPGKGHGVESGEEVDLDVELDGDGDGDGNDDQCTACLLEDGTLLCCDGCPRAYHLDCLPRSMQVRKGEMASCKMLCFPGMGVTSLYLWLDIAPGAEWLVLLSAAPIRSRCSRRRTTRSGSAPCALGTATAANQTRPMTTLRCVRLAGWSYLLAVGYVLEAALTNVVRRRRRCHGQSLRQTRGRAKRQ